MLKKLNVLSVILLFTAHILMAQSPSFEGEKVGYFLPLDKLFSYPSPVVATGVEFKTDTGFSVAFDYGIGFHLFDPSPSDYFFGGSNRDYHTTDWWIQDFEVQLKYFFKKRYSKFRLDKWRKKIKNQKKARLQNQPTKRYYWAIVFNYQPASYSGKNGYFFDSSNAPYNSGKIVYYTSARIDRAIYILGIKRGHQVRFKKRKGYYETGFTFGIRRSNVEFYKVQEETTPSSPFRFFFTSLYNNSYLFPPAFDIRRGSNTTPYITINFALGLY